MVACAVRVVRAVHDQVEKVRAVLAARLVLLKVGLRQGIRHLAVLRGGAPDLAALEVPRVGLREVAPGLAVKAAPVVVVVACLAIPRSLLSAWTLTATAVFPRRNMSAL
jgi:hypothetical protein